MLNNDITRLLLCFAWAFFVSMSLVSIVGIINTFVIEFIYHKDYEWSYKNIRPYLIRGLFLGSVLSVIALIQFIDIKHNS